MVVASPVAEALTRPLALHRIAVEIPTPKRAAACRADMPDADAFNRIRRSSLRACPNIHLAVVDVESASTRAVTSQLIHQSQHVL